MCAVAVEGEEEEAYRLQPDGLPDARVGRVKDAAGAAGWVHSLLAYWGMCKLYTSAQLSVSHELTVTTAEAIISAAEAHLWRSCWQVIQNHKTVLQQVHELQMLSQTEAIPLRTPAFRSAGHWPTCSVETYQN